MRRSCRRPHGNVGSTRGARERGDPRKFRAYGLPAWHRADRGITIATGVSQWDDLSGNANHQTQATGTKQPTQVLAALNGRPVIRGDGVDDWMQAGAFTLNQPETIFVTYKIRTRGTLNNHDILIDGGNTARMIIADDTTTDTFLHAGGTFALGSVVANNVFAQLTAVFNSASSIARVNGTQVATGDPSTQNGGGLTIFTLGFPTDARTLAADMAEIVCYASTMSTLVMRRIEKYMGAQFALFG